MDRHHLLGHVGERQVGDHAVVGDDAVQRVADPPGVEDVEVADHHRLGMAGGARGVDEGGDVVAADRREAGFGLLFAHFGGARQEIRPGGSAGDRLGAAHGDHRAQKRQALALGFHLGELLAVFDQDDRRFGVVDDVGHLLRRAGLVDADRDRPDRHGGEAENRPLGPIAAEDGDGLLRLDAERQQGAGALAYLGVVFLPGGGLPPAVDLFAVGDAIRTAASVVAQMLENGYGHE